ncbi:hypothetical protein KUTeg_003122 [Tegillarca granosa]|uniref:Laminin G domain-containing protein n=1 Tax=Tegillarca granosa TaxID=220873 RepID=A0ABQ9FMT8_TEGGR|nr:hypothetical protein KUTeg_003122 [Tegillarca granosa]
MFNFCIFIDFIYGRYVSDWSPYGPCSEICDKYGEQIRRRICLQQGKCSAEFEDKNEITMSKPCYNGPCPVDGGWSKWSEFTMCSADCGAGRMTRVRLCNEPEPVGSASCLGYSISTKNCMGKCNVDTCITHILALDKAKSADGGNWDDIRKGYTDLAKLQDAVPSGDPYVYSFNPKLEENYTPWSKWTKCSKTCDVGYRKRQRTCKDKSRVCLGEVRQLQYCNTISCPVKGEWSDWMSWSPCTTTCGEGKHFRYRRCDNPLPRQGGTCIGVGEESKDCNLRTCSVRFIKILVFYGYKGINVGFGEWGTWELCSKSCGLGERLRTRSCNVQTMDPEVKKMFQGMGTRDICTEKRTTETSACNPKPCPVWKLLVIVKIASIDCKTLLQVLLLYSYSVNGQWSTWNSWSECSENCGTGFHYRDRTCTQPAPANGGKLCQGPGSETIACFNGPCPDANHKGVIFNGKGWLKYEPRHKPIKFLALYLKFFPEVHSGMLLHRYKTCPKCNHHVKLYLEHGKATLLIRHKDAELKIQPKEKLKKKKWHTILVLVSGNVGFVRLNDGMHHYNGYTSPVGDEVSYDAPMIVGTDQAKKNGFKGMIAYLKVNFKELTLFDVAGWIGYGVPFDIIDTKSQVLDPVIDYPTFYGNSYMKLDITENKKISVAVSFWLKSLSAFLLDN